MSDTTAAAAQQAATTDPAGQTGTEQQPAGGTPSPADLAARAQQQQQQAPAGEQQQQELDTSGWPAEAREAYERQRERANNLQAEAAKGRLNAKAAAKAAGEQDMLAKVAQALGLAPAEDAPTIEAVTSELQQTREQAATAAKDAALVRAALAARVDPSRLDYFEFLASKDPAYRDATPGSDDFTATIAATVKTIVSTDPTLTGAAPARRSGAEAYGGASGSEITQDAFTAMSMSERSKLYTTDPETYRRLSDAEYSTARAR